MRGFGRCAGVILSGGLDDGIAGLAAIKAGGGLAMVQDPDEAEVPSMPRAALLRVDVDYSLSLADMAEQVSALAGPPIFKPPVENDMTRSAGIETEIAAGAEPRAVGLTSLGEPSMFTCPACAGVLLEMEQPPLRFRCHTGHAYTLETLAAGLAEKADDSLYIALRALQERDMILEQLGEAGSYETVTTEEKKVRNLADELRRLIAKNSAP